MGGHGGLNILPQKSWNVYNYDCREKVEKDEREHAEKEAKKRNLRLDGEFETRLGSLKAKKQRRSLEAAEENVAVAGGTVALMPADGALAHPQQSNTCGHINLFAVEENAEGNEEYAAEKKAEELEEKKQFEVQLGKSSAAYGGPDIEDTPWWSKPAAAEEAPRTAHLEAQLAYARTTEEINQLPVKQRWAKLRAISDAVDEESDDRHSKEKKTKKSKKHKKDKKDKSSKKRLEKMRKERLEREKLENFREAEISSLSQPRAPVKEHKYNAGYHRHLT